MDTKRTLKALGSGTAAVLLLAGVTLGADAILRTPGTTQTVVLSADQTTAPTGTPDATETADERPRPRAGRDPRCGRDA